MGRIDKTYTNSYIELKDIREWTNDNCENLYITEADFHNYMEQEQLSETELIELVEEEYKVCFQNFDGEYHFIAWQVLNDEELLEQKFR